MDSFIPTALPFIYTGLILYPFFLGYGMFRKDKSSPFSKMLVFIDFNKSTDNTNIYYKDNMFTLNVECNLLIDQYDYETLCKFRNLEIKFCDVQTEVNKLVSVLRLISKKNEYDTVVCIVSSNCYNLLVDEILEQDDVVKSLNIINSYGAVFEKEANIPMNKYTNEKTEREKRYDKNSINNLEDIYFMNTHAEYLYDEVLRVFPQFSECYLS
jgi:hypothetical protein